jgi:hypothetical protein
MKSIWQEPTRDELLARIDAITQSSSPKWGTFTADRMLSHLSEWMRMALGELDVPSKKMVIRHFPLKQLAIYVLPMPKGLPTAPELLKGKSAPVDAQKAELRALVTTLSKRAGKTDWKDHPAFGKLTTKAWGILAYRHTDHHLRQFGV